MTPGEALDVALRKFYGLPGDDWNDQIVWLRRELGTYRETAALFGVTERTLRNWRSRGYAPEQDEEETARYVKEATSNRLQPTLLVGHYVLVESGTFRWSSSVREVSSLSERFASERIDGRLARLVVNVWRKQSTRVLSRVINEHLSDLSAHMGGAELTEEGTGNVFYDNYKFRIR